MLTAEQAYARCLLAILTIGGMVWASEVAHEGRRRTGERTHR
jgi:hypothetical protein